MSTNQFRRYIDLLNEADAIPNPYANNPKQAAIYALLSPEDQEWATRGGGRPDLTDPYIANRAPNKFTPVAQAARPLMRGGTAPAQSNSETFGNANTELVPPNTNVALPSANTFSNDDAVAAALSQQNSDTRCAVCGTPQNQHQNLKHKFVPGGNTPPAPVPQVGATAGGGDVGRIKQLQRELKQAGANLGKTGAGRDGIDGDLGPLTQTAMSKYPDIAAKYADLSGSAAPVAQAATPAVDTGKLDAALTAIEGILSKYKGKLKEDRKSSTPADQMKQWRRLVEYSELTELDRPTKADIAAYMNNYAYGDDPSEKPTRKSPTRNPAAPAGGARAFDAMAGQLRATPTPTKFGTGTNMPTTPYQVPGASTSPNSTPAPAAAPAAPAGKGALRGAATIAGKAAGKALPGVGLALGAYDAYNRTKEGDYLGAGISGLAGLAALVPLVGTAAALGLTGVNVYRDLNKNPSVAITPEDAAVITQNLKIIQDWQKDPANQAALTPELKNRIENIIKGVASVGVPTAQAATPATTAPATTAPAPATAPATNSPAAAKLAPTLDGIDKLLKKYNFESQDFDSFFDSLTESEQRKFILKNLHLLSESEQMAERRDMLNEAGAWGAGKAGLQWLGKTLFKAGGGAVESNVAKAVRQATDAAQAAGKTPAEVAQAAAAAADAAHKAAKSGWRPGFWTGATVTAAAGVYGYFKIKEIIGGLLDTIKDPETAKVITITPEDTAAWIQFNKELEAALPDQATYDALPQDVKDRLSMIAARAEAMDKAMRASRKTTQ